MSTHDEIEQLIPWYVNGTLNEAEMDLVNRHVGRCECCAASVEREVRFARKLRGRPEDLPELPAPEVGWKRLANRLPKPQPLFGSAPAATLAAVMLVVASGAFLVGQQLQPPAFQTMTTPPTYQGPVIQLSFEPDVPEHTIRGVVLELGGTVIAGPTSTGVYRIGLPAGSDGAAWVARLRDRSAVRWVALEAP